MLSLTFLQSLSEGTTELYSLLLCKEESCCSTTQKLGPLASVHLFFSVVLSMSPFEQFETITLPRAGQPAGVCSSTTELFNKAASVSQLEDQTWGSGGYNATSMSGL